MNPIIQTTETITIPPIAQKTFDALWLYSLNAIMPTSTDGRLAVEFIPINSTTGEMLIEGKQEIAVADLPKALAEIPELQAAFTAIVQAVEPVKAWLTAQAQATEEPSNE